jgi:tetratricopeptide (TPR) repeat protein/predicted Ser/Thr protein kinase
MAGDPRDFDSTRPHKALTPGSAISHYEIEGKIGEGGMGVVYRARDTRLKRHVALKFLPPRLLCDSDAKERFVHEAQAASALNHPAIATIYEIEGVDNHCFIAMELIDGPSLKALAAEEAPSLKEILDLAIQIAEGLDAAHRKGVVHRDIKSDNIMVTADGRAKIMDFGLAKLKGATKVTREGTTMGTLQYMSPEQVEGGKVNGRSDIFSLGVVLYELITGRLPFTGDTEASVMNAIVTEEPEPLARYKSGIPEGVQRVVDRALSKEVRERYQHADDMAADLRHERRLLETGASRITKVRAPARKHRRLLPVIIPAAIAAVVAIVLLVFEPFRIEMGPGQEAEAEDNSLAVMYFENMVDPEDTERTAEMITALLITDLSESQYLQVVSRQRLYDILKLLGKQDLKIIDRSVAGDVAKHANARLILTGNVLQAEPRMVLTSDISDASTGKVVSSQRVTGEEGDDLFAVVDRLSSAIRDDLSLPAGAAREADRQVAEVTTHSAEAYRHYLEGTDAYHRFDIEAGVEHLSRAIEHDSTFAMAHLWLGMSSSGETRRAHLDKALEHMGRAGSRDQYLIRALGAKSVEERIRILEEAAEKYPDDKEVFYWLGIAHSQLNVDLDRAIEAFTRTVEIDPMFKIAYNSLAYAYDARGELDRSIWAINKYIELAPDEPNPYDSRGDLYLSNGRPDDAIRPATVEIKSDYMISVVKLGLLYLLEEKYEKAEPLFRQLTSRSQVDIRAQGRAMLALIPLHQGKYGEALLMLEDGLAADRVDGYEGWWTTAKLRWKMIVHLARQDKEMLVATGKEVESARRRLNPEDPSYSRDLRATMLADMGYVREAEELMEEIRRNYGSAPEEVAEYLHLRAYLMMVCGKPDSAVHYLSEAGQDLDNLPVTPTYLLAYAYLVSGDNGKAVELLEEMVSGNYIERAWNPDFGAPAYYFLGRAYEESGWTERAIEQYEIFLRIWKDADPGLMIDPTVELPGVEEARARLARLKAGA